MQLSWRLRLSAISAILASLCILSSGTSTAVILTKDTTNHESSPNALSGPVANPPTLPHAQPISKRSPPNTLTHTHATWGNGWTSRSINYLALLPMLPAATHLATFYARISSLASSLPPTLAASAPSILHGMRGEMVRFQCGDLEMRFWSMNTKIPWSFVGTVAARLVQESRMGFPGLHGTVFQHEVKGLVVFVTVTAAGVAVPLLSA